MHRQDGRVLAAVGSGKTTTLSERVATASPAGRPTRARAGAYVHQPSGAAHARASPRETRSRRDARMSTPTGSASILRTEASPGPEPLGLGSRREDAEALIASLGVQKPRQAMFRLHAEMSSEPIGGASSIGTPPPPSNQSHGREGYLERSANAGPSTLVVWCTSRGRPHRVSIHRREVVTAVRLGPADEVQDTHLRVRRDRHMADRAQSLCLVGDLDQTIYGWP